MKFFFLCLRGASVLAKGHKLANIRHFKQQVIVFEINMNVNNPKCVIWNQVFFYLQSTQRSEIRPSHAVAVTGAYLGYFMVIASSA